MKVYHVTSAASAAEIDAQGFVDATGTYLTANEYTGTWVANVPLTENEGVVPAEAAFEIEIAEEELRAYEWIEEGKWYREWLVPAATLNAASRRKLTEDEMGEIWYSARTALQR